MKRKWLVAIAMAIGTMTISACAPTHEPFIDTVQAAAAGTSLVQSTEKIVESCGSSLFKCAQPLYEVHFNAPAVAPAENICADFIKVAMKLGAIAYSSLGSPAGQITNQQEVQDLCVSGLDKIVTYPDGTKTYLGLTMYDDGSKDGIGKVDTLERREDGTWQAMFAFGRDMGRIGYIIYGDGSLPTHLFPSPTPSD